MKEAFSDFESRLLDRFAPPPMSSDFADRVAAQLLTHPAMAPRRRDPRGGWRRGRVALIAGVGSALLSVGAAASGILGVTVQNMPVITTIATAVDAPRASRAPDLEKPVKAAAAMQTAKPLQRPGTNDLLTAPDQIQPGQGQLLADKIEARMRWREAQGLSVPSLAGLERRRDALRAEGSPRADTMTAAIAILKERADAGNLPSPRILPPVNRAEWRARMAALSPEERAVVRERRDARQQKRLSGEAALADGGGTVTTSSNAEPVGPGRLRERWREMSPEQRAEWRARREAREALMTPEQRQQLQERRDARRREMLRGREGVTGGPYVVPLESDTPQ